MKPKIKNYHTALALSLALFGGCGKSSSDLELKLDKTPQVENGKPVSAKLKEQILEKIKKSNPKLWEEYESRKNHYPFSVQVFEADIDGSGKQKYFSFFDRLQGGIRLRKLNLIFLDKNLNEVPFKCEWTHPRTGAIIKYQDNTLEYFGDCPEWYLKPNPNKNQDLYLEMKLNGFNETQRLRIHSENKAIKVDTPTSANH